MPLTETRAKYAKPRERAYKLADSEGLFLLVQPNGTKLWRMKYRFAGKEKLLSFGAYPAVGIAAARDKRKAAKALQAELGPQLSQRDFVFPGLGLHIYRRPHWEELRTWRLRGKEGG